MIAALAALDDICPMIPPQNDVFHVAGMGIGQSEILQAGLVIAGLSTIAYRLITRGKRY